jgi:hypothetical protein
MLELEDLGEKPAQGGTNTSFVHWIGTRVLLSRSHQAAPSDHHRMVRPCCENATSPSPSGEKLNAEMPPAVADVLFDASKAG